MVATKARPQTTEPQLKPLHPSVDEPRHTAPATSPIVDRRVIQGRDRVIYFMLVAVWITLNTLFWHWWFQVDHVVTWPRFVIATMVLGFDVTAMPSVMIFFLWKMKRPDPLPPAPDLRVVMVTAIVPSVEAIDVLEKTLAGMVSVRYPHDNWVLDEGGDPRVRALCTRYGAHYWSRKGITRFNQPEWPYQTKTKSGNYNAWFTDVAYDRYDFMVQLDSDHVPVPSYLDEVLGYFQDPEIAYVALPSVYRNIEDWTTRGSSEQNQLFHGPLQMGYYGWTRTPMIIGSHAAYRMSHLEEIGGFGPSRAEDHLDTLKLAQRGHRGVFVPKVLAEGLGPHNVADYLAQDHQWAFSITQVLLKYGRTKELLTLRQRIVFLFSELWYGLFSVTYSILFLLPLMALVSGRPIVSVSLIEFLALSVPLTVTTLSMVGWIYHRRWLKPESHFFISWQGMVLAVARWPIVLIALFNAVISLVFRQGRFNYMVTPKGAGKVALRRALQSAAPYVLLAAIATCTPIAYAWFKWDPDGDAAGYVVFALLSAMFFTIILGAVLIDFVRANIKAGSRLRATIARSVPLIGVTFILVTGMVLSGSANRLKTTAAITYWPENVARDSSQQGDVAAATATTQPQATPQPAATATALAPVTSWLFDPGRTGTTFGAYDPSGELALVSGIDHIFATWLDDPVGGAPVAAIEQSYGHGRPVLLSVEPWPLNGRPTDTLLQDITAGSYDAVIQRYASTIRTMQQPILIRWGHEMDLDGLYPWSQGDPSAYVAAYQHVVDLFRSEGATNALWVWSPGGQLSSLEYYPGDGYVDYVGISVLEYTRWEIEIARVETPRPLTTLVNEKYDLLASLGKPMILAEIGIDLDPTLKTERINEMIQMLPSYPSIRGVVYFNYQNPGNQFDQDRPQWALSAADMDALWNTIAQSPWMEQQSMATGLQLVPADPLKPR